MINRFKLIITTSFVLLLTACGFHFQNGELIPPSLKILKLESSDPFSPMTIAMRQQLQSNNITLVDDNPDVPVLRINKIVQTDNVASIFKTGREAEKILCLDVTANLMINHQSYPINAKINRTFFDNSRAALAKFNEKTVIWQDMYEQAARQLIIKMITFKNVDKQ